MQIKLSFFNSFLIIFLKISLITPAYSNDFLVDIDKVLSSDHRSITNKARDKYRNPKQTLNFFGLKKNMSVIEVSPGKGWYTEVLAPTLKKNGKFYATIYKVSDDSRPFIKKLDSSYRSMLKKHPEKYSKTNLIPIDLKNPKFNLSEKVDMILTFRNVHNWTKAKTDLIMFKSFFNSLKQGGILGVVEHRAKPNTPIKKQIETGYMTEEYVKNLANKVGFKFVSSSDINNNPKDNKNYSGGVWTLLPNLRGVSNSEKDKYMKIGESDRMTLKFEKP